MGTEVVVNKAIYGLSKWDMRVNYITPGIYCLLYNRLIAWKIIKICHIFDKIKICAI